MSERYVIHSGNPFFVWDTLLLKNSSSHDSYESASARAYILNRYYVGGAL